MEITENTCRVCLKISDDAECNSLFDEVDYEEGMQPLVAIINRLTKISNSTDLPTKICVNCTDKLLTAYEFVLNVEKSEAILSEATTVHCVDDEEEDDVKQQSIEQVDEDNQEFEFLDDYQELITTTDNENNNDEATTSLDSDSEKIDQKIQYIFHDTLITHAVVDVKSLKDEDDSNASTASNAVNKTTENFDIKKSPGVPMLGSRLHSRAYSQYQFQCDKCVRTFAKEESLNKHMSFAHTYATPEQIAAVAPKPTDSKPFVCNHCPRIFARKDNLTRHMLAIHSNELDAIALSQENERTKKQKYKRGICPHCGKSFTLSSLAIHIRRHTGETPYVCAECGKGFPRRQDLTLHERHHTGEKPHICTICGKSFIRLNKLNRHMFIHTGLRPHKCDVCGRGFAQSNDLKIHMRRHTGEKPYKCDECGLGFICGTALRQHGKQTGHEQKNQNNVDPYASCRVNNRVKKESVTNNNYNSNDDLILDIELEEDEQTEVKSQNDTDEFIEEENFLVDVGYEIVDSK